MNALRPDGQFGGSLRDAVAGSASQPALLEPGQLAPPLVAARPRPLLRGRVRLIMAVDVLALLLAGAGTVAAATLIAPPAFIAPDATAIPLALAALTMWIFVFSLYGLYEAQTRTIAPGTFDEISTLFNALLAGSLVELLVSQGLERVQGWSVYTPVEALMFVALAIVLVPIFRWMARTWLLPRAIQPRRALIVGAGVVGRMIERKLADQPGYGLVPVGFVDDVVEEPRVVGRTQDLTRLVDDLAIDWVIVASADVAYAETLERVRAVRRPDTHLSIVPSYYELFASHATLEDLEGVPVVTLPPMRLSRTARLIKRSFDVVASAAGLLLLSPLLLVTAIVIKRDSPGPVFFGQLRRGRANRTFRILKFRTMVEGAESHRERLASLNEVTGPLFKIKSDPRVTRVGGFLRKWSIDELPQLWNVLRGEMSLVGPRPFVIHEAEQITGWAARRLETTPGITGLWQVSGRNDMPFDEMVKLDYVYVTNWSLWWDVKILCQTLPVVFARRGAY